MEVFIQDSPKVTTFLTLTCLSISNYVGLKYYLYYIYI